MAESIYNLLNKPVANLNRNGFDLGEFFPWSMKLGQVKPISYFHTVPGGSYRISVDEICHTEPFITDPFVRLSKHIECVFVPYSQLWHGASQFFGHASDPVSSYEHDHQYVPNFSLGRMLNRIYTHGSSAATTDIQGLYIGETALSLLDMLGYGAHPLYQMDTEERENYISSLNDTYVNAWALLAYNKYWNSYLRDTQHTSPLSPSIFNADKVPCDSVATSHMDDYYNDIEMLQLVTIKYRKVKRDIFTSSLTSRQFGAVEGVQFNFDLVGDGSKIGEARNASTWLSASNSYLGTSGSQPVGQIIDAEIKKVSVDGSIGTYQVLSDSQDALSHRHNIYDGLPIYSVNGQTIASANGGFDVYTLLTAQMMQKWREQIQRAGNQTEDRLRAIYGRSPQSDAQNHPYVFGSTSYNIVASQVVSTGSSDTAALGDIAAKGQGYSQRNEFRFDASEFGIILVCTYILPENSYLAPIDKLNTLIEPFDYWVPQLENLGLEPIERKFNATLYYVPSTGKYRKLNDDSIVGYAARNWAYKQKVNKVHLGFQHGVENSKWMPSRTDTDVVTNLDLNPYYVAPNEYDTVFDTATDWHLDTDQFIGCSRVSCDSVLPMSELGTPRW